MMPPFSCSQHQASREIQVARCMGSAPIYSGLENKAVGMLMNSIIKKASVGGCRFHKDQEDGLPAAVSEQRFMAGQFQNFRG